MMGSPDEIQSHRDMLSKHDRDLAAIKGEISLIKWEVGVGLAVVGALVVWFHA